MIKKLLNKKMKFLKNQQGLTLIELLVVIVILGIIAAIAIPAVLNNRTDAALNVNEQSASILQDAVNRYQAVNGSKPDITGSTIEAVLTNAGAGGPYIETWPQVKEVGNCKPATGATSVPFTYTSGKITLPSVCLPSSSKYAAS